MSNKTANMHTQNLINWLLVPDDESNAFTVGSIIEHQIEKTQSQQDSLIQQLMPGIFLLTIFESEDNTSLNIKKISDRVQYSILPSKFNNDNFIKISYHQLRNLCHVEPDCSWAKIISGQHQNKRIHVIFFYHLQTLLDLWQEQLSQHNFHIKEQLSNRLLIISDGTFCYPYNLAILAALCLWRQRSFLVVVRDEINLLKKRFALFPRIYRALAKSSPDNWSLDNGAINYISGEEIKSFDYATITDDILHAQRENNLEDYIDSFNINDLDARSAFPTISVRSLVHLRARPDVLSSLEKGYVLCAAIESNGKQTPIQTNNRNNFEPFNLWFKRAVKHLCRHNYQARVVMINENSSKAFSLVGEQVSTIAIFPKLIKGVLEQLNLGAEKSVRLIAHNEDVLTIASLQASWNDINEINNKAMSLFKMVSSDGADPLSLFEQVELPPHGAGTFHLSLVPEEYFQLVNTAITRKYSLPPGHAHYLLGLSFECLREWTLAVNEFQKALRLDSHDSGIISALGSALIELGKFEQALPFLKRAYDELPEDADLANTLGSLHLNFGNLAEAIAAFERAVRLSPGSAHFLANLGNGYLLAARPGEALEVLNKAIRCNPSLAQAHERLAELHLQSGDEDLAKKHALIAYRENPVDTNIANLLWRLTVGKKNKHNT